MKTQYETPPPTTTPATVVGTQGPGVATPTMSTTKAVGSMARMKRLLQTGRMGLGLALAAAAVATVVVAHRPQAVVVPSTPGRAVQQAAAATSRGSL